MGLFDRLKPKKDQPTGQPTRLTEEEALKKARKIYQRLPKREEIVIVSYADGRYWRISAPSPKQKTKIVHVCMIDQLTGDHRPDEDSLLFRKF